MSASASTVSARIAAGLCPHCGRSAAPGRRYCRRYLRRSAKRHAKSRADRTARGLCTTCLLVPSMAGYRNCAGCVEHARVTQAERVGARAREGLCIICADPNPEAATRRTCRPCSAAKAKESAAWKAAKLEAGLLCRCGRLKPAVAEPCAEGHAL